MTDSKNDSLSLKDIEVILQKQIAIGEILACCPLCNQYLSYQEYKLRKCSNCKKEIKFEDILYHRGAEKNNN